VGEHSREVRRRAADRLGFLGVVVDDGRAVAGDVDVSASRAAVRTLVISAREDLQIAGETRQVLDPAQVAAE